MQVNTVNNANWKFNNNVNHTLQLELHLRYANA